MVYLSKYAEPSGARDAGRPNVLRVFETRATQLPAEGLAKASDMLAAPPPCNFPTRQSFDKTICPFGRRLLEICETSDLVILNGRVPGDEAGLFTCPQKNGPGESVVGYFLATSSLMTSVSSLIITEEPSVSYHCSLRLGLTLKAQNCETPAQPLKLEKQAPEVKVQKIKFRADRVDAYREKLSDLLGRIFSTPNAPCTRYATALQDCIAQAALASFGKEIFT